MLVGSQKRNDFYKDSNRNRTDQVKEEKPVDIKHTLH